MHERKEMALRKTVEPLVSELDTMARLHRLAMLSVSEAGVEPILGEIVDAAIALSDADFGTIQLLDPVSSDLKIVSHRGLPQWWLDFWQNVSTGQSGSAMAFERGERVLVEDVEQSPMFAGTPGLEMQLKAGVRALQLTPLVSQSGKPLGMLSTHYKKPHRPDERTLQLLDLLARQAADVIEHTQVTSALRQNEVRYRLLAEQVTDGIFVTDSHGRYLDANRAGCEMLGYKLEELLALSVPDVITSDELEKLPSQFEHLATGRIAQNEWRFKRKDGSVFVGELVSHQVPGGRLQGIVRDVTERKRADEALRVSEERFRVALQSSPVVVFNQDHELRYTWINSPVLGWAVQDYIGRTDAEIVGGDEGARLMAIKQTVLQSGIGTRTETTVTYQGETHSFDLTVDPLRDDQGALVGITCAAVDVTPLKQAAVELERLNELKNEFLGMAAHDLRNPIGGILILAEVLRDEVATMLTEEQLQYLSGIRKSSKFMLQLIDELLDISSIEAGHLHLDRRRSDLSKLLERNVRLNAKLARKKHIRVGLQIAGPLPRLSLDEGKITQVLNNLISNAVKFSQPATTVEVLASAHEGGVLISVRDKGPGIPEAEQAKLFQPFGRTSVRSTSGERSTGLGLVISRRIVEGHGGRIWVESQVGVGSVFLFKLPA